jgi:hypothetical protein
VGGTAPSTIFRKCLGYLPNNAQYFAWFLELPSLFDAGSGGLPNSLISLKFIGSNRATVMYDGGANHPMVIIIDLTGGSNARIIQFNDVK